MIKEEVIIHSEAINRLNQQVYFQIALPKDAEKIIGVETGAFRQYDNSLLRYTYGDMFTVYPVEIIGRLSLINPASSDIFYQEDIKQMDSSPKFGDFTSYLSFTDLWSVGKKNHEANVSTKCCAPFIEGHYKDSWGSLYNVDFSYRLNIYIWISKVIKS